MAIPRMKGERHSLIRGIAMPSVGFDGQPTRHLSERDNSANRDLAPDSVVFTATIPIIPPNHRNPASIVMRWCLRFTHSAWQLGRHSLSWRTARLFCAVWFTLTSIGLPVSLSQMSENSCTRNPGSQCRCSLTKRMSGTCCCARESQPKSAKSCCSVKKSASRLSEPISLACCSSKAPRVELSISRCECSSDSPEGASLIQEPRLPVTLSAISLPETNVAFCARPAERVESALLLPLVPPPKVVL